MGLHYNTSERPTFNLRYAAGMPTLHNVLGLGARVNGERLHHNRPNIVVFYSYMKAQHHVNSST